MNDDAKVPSVAAAKPAYRMLRDWRIGWAQGAIMRGVRTLDRVDPGWQKRPHTLRLLGLVDFGKPEGGEPRG